MKRYKGYEYEYRGRVRLSRERLGRLEALIEEYLDYIDEPFAVRPNVSSSVVDCFYVREVDSGLESSPRGSVVLEWSDGLEVMS